MKNLPQSLKSYIVIKSAYTQIQKNILKVSLEQCIHRSAQNLKDLVIHPRHPLTSPPHHYVTGCCIHFYNILPP